MSEESIQIEVKFKRDEDLQQFQNSFEKFESAREQENNYSRQIDYLNKIGIKDSPLFTKEGVKLSKELKELVESGASFSPSWSITNMIKTSEDTLTFFYNSGVFSADLILKEFYRLFRNMPIISAFVIGDNDSTGIKYFGKIDNGILRLLYETEKEGKHDKLFYSDSLDPMTEFKSLYDIGEFKAPIISTIIGTIIYFPFWLLIQIIGVIARILLFFVELPSKFKSKSKDV